MEPLLTKDEIADLLGVVQQEGQGTPQPSEKKTSGTTAPVREFNLFQRNNVADGQRRLPNLDVILDSFAQTLSVSLTNQLQRTFQILPQSIDAMTFRQYMETRENGVATGVLQLAPLKNGALLSFTPGLSFAIIEIMFGAALNVTPLELKRKLTTIEMHVLHSVMTNVCTEFDKSMEAIIPLKSSVIKIESDPSLLSITDPEAEVLIGRFTVGIGSISGTMEIIFPLSTFEPLREQFKNLLKSNRATHGGWADHIAEDVVEMPLTLIAQSGELSLPVRKILDMKVGDIIDIDYDPIAPLKVLVEDRLKFFAVSGVHNKKKVIHLTGVYEKGARHGRISR